MYPYATFAAKGSIKLRKLATGAFAFSAAVIMSHYLVPASWGTFCCVIFVFVSFIGLFFSGNTRLRIFLIFLGLAAGFFWNNLYISVFYKPAEYFYDRSQTVSAVVLGEPEPTDYGSKVLVSIMTNNGPRIKTQLYSYGRVPDVKPGNTIELTALFRTADTIYGEATEKFVSNGIYLMAHVSGDITITDASEPIIFFPIRLAHELQQMIEEIFPQDVIAFMRALILGNTSGVYKDTALAAALGTTGTSHIISVSGMNIAFLMGFMGLCIKKKHVATAIGIPVIVIFITTVGFMPPVTRAGIMQIFLLSAPIFKRENDNVTSLAAALFLILLCNPFAAASAGLQLSFSATLGILLFSEKIFSVLEDALHKWKIYENRVIKATVRFIIASFATTGGALILSVPLIALHFGTVSLIAPLANLCILWAVTLAFCGGIIAVVIGFIYAPIGSIIAFFVALLARYCQEAIKVLSHFPFASVYTSNPVLVIWLVYVYMLFITVVKRGVRRWQLLYPVCLSAIALCLILLCTSIFSDGHHLSVTALDVGQGQSIVVTSGKYTAVIDCGSSSGKDAGGIVTKYLQSHGRTQIDLLVLTHYHSDHANGAISLLERYHVGSIALPAPSIDDGALPVEIIKLAQVKEIGIINVSENLVVTFGNATMTLYAPIGSEGENERGLSVLCSEKGFEALITGDMNGDNERRLIMSAQLPDIELLVVGHHGAKQSTSDELLVTVKPETAIISSGYNTYGHPAPETLQKLALAGIMTYRTDESGHISISGW